MRVAVLGNSGSGKSTLARWLAGRAGAPALDLDEVYWEPGQVAVPRTPEAARERLSAFCSGNADWVVEGCYASLIQAALAHSPLLIFLNLDARTCLDNCRARPWEPHKYSSREEQDARLDFLLRWVEEYYAREGEMSLAGHRACFDAYSGRKVEVTSRPQLDPPSAETLSWS